KSVVELPSPYAGTVLDLLAAEGSTVEVGTPIIAVGSPGEAAEPAPASGVPGVLGEGGEPGADRPRVGSGPQADPARPRRRAAPAPVAEPEPARPAGWTEKLSRGPLGGGIGTAAQGIAGRAARLAGDSGVWRRPGRGDGPAAVESVPRRPALAKPPVRKAARDLGVDLAD